METGPSRSLCPGMPTRVPVGVGPSCLFIGLLNHGKRGHTPAYLWVIGMAVCGDKDMADLAAVWAENLQVLGGFVLH